MRILVQSLFRIRDAHPGQTQAGLFPGRRFAQTSVQPQNLANLITYGQHRVKRGHRFLKNHGDTVASNRPHLRSFQGHQVSARKQDLP